MAKSLSSIVKSSDNITKMVIGLDQVDNTSDLAKPISVATSIVLAGKQNILINGTNIKSISNINILGPGNININGDIIGSGTGSTLTLNLTTTGVTPGTYNNVTVNASGRVTAATNVSLMTFGRNVAMAMIFGY